MRAHPRARSRLLHRLGRGLIAPLVGAKMVQEVVAVAACGGAAASRRALRLGDRRRGHEDDLLHADRRRRRRSRSTCSRRAAAAPGRSSRRRRASCRFRREALAAMPYAGMSLHKVSSKCGIFAETDANTLVKSGVPGGGDHREPLRGRGLPEPRDAHQGQHADAAKCCCSAAPISSSRGSRRRGGITWQALGRAQGRAARRPRRRRR